MKNRDSTTGDCILCHESPGRGQWQLCDCCRRELIERSRQNQAAMARGNLLSEVRSSFHRQVMASQKATGVSGSLLSTSQPVFWQIVYKEKTGVSDTSKHPLTPVCTLYKANRPTCRIVQETRYFPRFWGGVQNRPGCFSKPALSTTQPPLLNTTK